MFVNTWDRAYLRMSGGCCISDNVCFWRKSFGWKWLEELLQISSTIVLGEV